jgi:hypothetical protein
VFVSGSRVATRVHLQIDVRPLLQSQTAWRPLLHLRTGTIEVNVKDNLPTETSLLTANAAVTSGGKMFSSYPNQLMVFISSFSDHVHK